MEQLGLGASQEDPDVKDKAGGGGWKFLSSRALTRIRNPS